jgi:aerobic-type carbon monoxide dehydrogenase small subunit (CoxS/CutS family)
MVNLKVNGSEYHLEVDPDTPLLWVLREQLQLTGTKYSCGTGECGACTVHVDGEAVQSCVTTVSEVVGREITTIEGLAGPVADGLKEAWLEEEVSQCGYCQPAQIMTAAALLSIEPRPDDDKIKRAMSGVLCRCGTYQESFRAIKKVLEP